MQESRNESVCNLKKEKREVRHGRGDEERLREGVGNASRRTWRAWETVW